ncbi:hypothetical protein OF376_02385 [Ureaplasma miroungigenitalium]|uniref:Uncharacterized protein n=1 Tax=Ureaplasma miroungigenitalium TaxID=1042321 RepID=A0ABT3BMX9_9BACT|nr:hypothetical protein [Ureaplasma miroungigenitalium]MCV3728609.1 hypothetical protein [Ureaplasma miroungigenitalium]
MPVITPKVARVRTFFQEYKRARHQLKALDIINDYSPSIATNVTQSTKWSKTLVEYTQIILNNMSHEGAEILTHLYINEYQAKQLNYSPSSFYVKHKKAVDEFISLLNVYPSFAEKLFGNTSVSF